MADLQTLIDAGMTPEDAAALMSPMQQYGSGLLSPALAGSGVGVMSANYQTFTAPLSNKGNPTSRINKSGNTFDIASGAPIRLIDNRTKQVVYEGSGYDAAQEAIRIAQDMSNTFGKKASWELQSTSPGGDAWTTLAKEKKNKGILGAIADVALPVVGTMINPVLGAAVGSAMSSGLQGRSLGDTLKRAVGSAGVASALGSVGSTGLLGGLTKNLGLTDYLTLGSLGASAVGGLLGGGGGGASTQSPYRSPFGGMTGIGGIGVGQDMRANPNIADYEQYGFGPEATFFKPEYNQLVSSTFQPTTQAYKPLING